MKVQIKQLKPNPYRDMENYPINQDKIRSLINSIEQTGFWENILARNINGIIQIAYGHHRLAALKQVMHPDDYIDIPVKDLDDATMIQIMANENMDDWKTTPSVIFETVRVAHDFLTVELAKYERWEDAPRSLIDSLSLDSRHKFEDIKSKGVGQTTILKFLGGNWKQHMIQEALKDLNLIKNDVLDRRVISDLPSMEHMKSFTKHVEKRNIPKEKQIEYAKEIKDQDISKREMDDFFVSKEFKQPQKKSEKQSEKIIKYESYVAGIRNKADELFGDLKELVKTENDLGEISENIYRKLLMMSLDTLSKQIQLVIKNKKDEKTESGNATIRSIAQ